MRRTPPSAPELLTSVEVAKLLRVHPKQVYRLLAKGLPARRVGAGWRFMRDEVLAWAAADAGSIAAPRPGESRPPSAPLARSNASETGAGSSPPPSPAATPRATPPLLAANGDVAVESLLSAVALAGPPLLGLVASDRVAGLAYLAERAVLMAGYHAGKPPSHLGTERLARVHLVVREVGLAFPGAPSKRGLSLLARKRLASRPATAGVRAHLDAALAKAGKSLAELGVSSREHASHRDAVSSVLRGDADVALTTSAWAERGGLAFHPLASEPYDLLLYAGDLGEPASIAVCEILQTDAFRKVLARVAGYDVARSGDIRYEFASTR